MRTRAILITSLLVAGGALAAQGRQSAPGTPLLLEIGVRGYLAGGQMGSMAGDSATDRLESYVWADQTLCGMGAGDEVPRNTPAFGWHFIGTVTDRSPGQLTVRVEWQRMWDKGARRPGSAGGAQTLTLRSGERVELDRVAASGDGRCGTVEAKLEASVAPRAAYLMTGVRGGAAGAGGRGTMSRPQIAGEPSGTTVGAAGGGAGRGGGSASGSGSGGDATAVRPASGVRGGRGGAGGGGTTYGGSTTTTEPGVARGGRGGSAAGAGRGGTAAGVASGSGSGAGTGAAGEFTRPSVAQAGRGGGRGGSANDFFGYLGGSYDAEVWLVHKQPGGAETVQQQTLRFGPGARDFAFPPVQVSGRGEPITLDITGRLQSRTNRYELASRQMGMALREYQLAYAEASNTRAQQGQARGGRQGAGVAPADPNQPPMLVVSISRRARRGAPFIDTRGATDVSIEIPKPNDVLSFELPPLQKETEDLLKGHTFSIRLRVTPVK
jgi:hypothetical protein